MTLVERPPIEPRLKGSTELWRQAAELRAAGLTFREVGRRLGVSYTAVRVCLIRPATPPKVMKAPPRAACIHCGKRKPCRPRYLCEPCFSDIEIRDQYPPRNVYGRRGVGHKGRGGAVTPAVAPPRSTDRLQEMIERAERGQALFHASDRLDRR